MESILAVTRSLAAPFDLTTLLAAVASSACRVLRAQRCSVWLLDAATGELAVRVASDLREIRILPGTGLAGACAQLRRPINVPDCYADARFDPSVDRHTGFRTRCSLSLPLIDHRDELVGVMQVLNKEGGVFDAADLRLAEALAAQCGVALSRVRMTEAAIESERMRRDLELARDVQRHALPAAMPRVPGYDLHGHFLPQSLTGGDTYDVAPIDQGLLLVLGDATGHGIGPALSVLQMHAMLRMAFRLGGDLETAFRQVNDQLAETLPDARFVTAFIGLLDAQAHRLRFLSGGQGPILHVRPSAQACTRYRATSFPMGAMRIETLRPAIELELGPGDVLALLSDGVYEYENAAGESFGADRVEQVLLQHADDPAAALADRLLAAVRVFAGGAPQADDITMVLLKRDAAR